MNRENYKRLGDYIRLVDVRNRDLSVTNLLGVSISKTFIPSIANTIGTDMSTYKIVEPYQFAYGPVTSRNGDKITFALYKGAEKCIVSSAYVIFEVVDKEKLDPDYLMMWALRPEFDRYARFMSNGSAREIFSWDDMCEVYLPIPDINEQRRIVAEYQAVEKRIATNEDLIAKLEETSSELFLNKIAGYLSSDPIPADWQKSNLPGIAQFLNGVACQKYEPEEGETSVPVIKIREIGIGDTDTNSDLASLDVPKKYIINKGDLLFSWSASLIVTTWCGKKGVLNQHIFKVIPSNYPTWFCYHWIKYYLNEWNNFISAKATSMGHLKLEDLDNAAVVVPSKQAMQSFDSMMSPMFEYATELKREVLLLNNMKDILLARLSKA